MRVPLRVPVRVPRAAAPACAPSLSAGARQLHAAARACDPASTNAAHAVPVDVAGLATPAPAASVASGAHVQGPVVRYDQLVDQGTLSDDPFQRQIAAKFQSLCDAISSHQQSPPETPPSTVDGAKQWIEDHPLSSASQVSGGGLFGKLFSAVGLGPSSSTPSAGTDAAAMPPPGTPRGLYLYGDVGTGKSMLMDLFYDTLPSRVTRKERIHFHQFMIDVHKRAHFFKKLFGEATNAKSSNLSSASAGDATVPSGPAGQLHLQVDVTDLVAREIANKAEVLCFDEFQVTDIADAMILRTLLTRLIVDYGVVVVLTSNRHPTELYRNGIQRESFIPAIKLLERALDVVDLDSGTDYRRRKRAQTRVYFDAHQPADKVAFHTLWEGYLNAAGGPPAERQGEQVEVWGRTLTVPYSIKPTQRAPISASSKGDGSLIAPTTVAKFDFTSLCGSPTSAADYIAVCKAYKVVFVEDVPRMGIDQRDVARRFITFIDAVYEAHTQLILLTDGPVLHLFLDPNKQGATDDSYDPTVARMLHDQGLSSDALQGGGKPIFAGEEELFAFARVLSRLTEMGTVAYATKARSLAQGLGRDVVQAQAAARA